MQRHDNIIQHSHWLNRNYSFKVANSSENVGVKLIKCVSTIDGTITVPVLSRIVVSFLEKKTYNATIVIWNVPQYILKMRGLSGKFFVKKSRVAFGF